MSSSRIAWRQCALHAHNGLVPAPLLSALQPRAAGAARRLAHNDARKSPSLSQRPTPPPRSSNPLINPPASTRPPPLTVPQRSTSDSAFQYYFQLGKGYLRFYKDGLKGVWANRKLLREKLERTPADDRPSIWRPFYVPRTFSRADWVLLWRVRHDLLRLPLFGLMLIVIGEFTALVVIYVDGVVPYTCRIPKQIATGLQKAEDRRRSAFDELEARFPHGVLSPLVTPGVARNHVLRSLHLAGTMWDRLGFIPPGMWQVKGRLRMAFLEGDDRNLIEDGGPSQLEPGELRIACAERGIDVVGRSETELRGVLGDWLRLTAAEDITERRRRMATLLLTRPEHWPQKRDFAVPDWEL
ncbi:LETM1-like protein [Purpureocillium lilacinum]|uniref:LETM1-like protein n=1 Tax=Purpureocillium lilacinum TaxID=33203 RepID=A0A179GC99_PURLI|nr:LETM1-like protein [Purpureocillium lilacinum]